MPVDMAFIRGREETRQAAYVPLSAEGEPIGRSGVTVATGIDLGQINDTQLRALMIPQTLKAKLMPYLGIRGAGALSMLEQRRLSLTKDEVSALDKAIEQSVIGVLRWKYNHAAPGSGPRGGWDELTSGQQTVLASVAWQYGPHLDKACPRLWRAALKQDWTAVLKELRDFGDHYRSRREAEANYLEEEMKA